MLAASDFLTTAIVRQNSTAVEDHYIWNTTGCDMGKYHGWQQDWLYCTVCPVDLALTICGSTSEEAWCLLRTYMSVQRYTGIMQVGPHKKLYQKANNATEFSGTARSSFSRV